MIQLLDTGGASTPLKYGGICVGSNALILVGSSIDFLEFLSSGFNINGLISSYLSLFELFVQGFKVDLLGSKLLEISLNQGLVSFVAFDFIVDNQRCSNDKENAGAGESQTNSNE